MAHTENQAMQVALPPTSAFAGSRLGPTVYLLTRPEIREAEELSSADRYPTKDGIVIGREGDIAITAYGGERYPILRNVFFGTYRLIGRVGSDLVAERLIHVRRAWEVLDDGASFDYGPGRGRVPVARGSWLYQTDEDDFGTIHPDVKHQAHFEAGIGSEIERVNWRARRDRWLSVLHWIPPVMAALALVAFMLQVEKLHGLAATAIASELMLLSLGGAMVWWMKRQRWLLRACVQTAIEVARDFQTASGLLGQRKSTLFPGMALWRAAQSSAVSNPLSDPTKLEALKLTLARVLARLDREMHRLHHRESRVNRGTAAAFVAILMVNLLLLGGAHGNLLEFTVIWLPTVVAAVHGIDLRKRTSERLSKIRAFADELRFAHVRIFESGTSPAANPTAVIQVICRSAAEYTQHELRLALATETPLPV